MFKFIILIDKLKVCNEDILNSAFFINLSLKRVAIYKQSIESLCLNINTSPGVDISSCLLLNYVNPKSSMFTRTQKGIILRKNGPYF